MMKRYRCLCLLIACVLLAGMLGQSLAGVTARVDRRGNYLGTQLVPAGPQSDPRVWSVRSRGLRAGNALNPGGDLNGDLWPTIVESPREPHYSWVTWSRFNGTRHSIAWSRWTDRGWSSIEWLADKYVRYDQLDPAMTLDAQGRPFVAYWSEEGGKGRVYLSLFLATRWMKPIPISAAELDSRAPEIRLGKFGRVVVEYDTDEGRMSQVVLLSDPGTITDDINPQGRLTLRDPTPMAGAF